MYPDVFSGQFSISIRRPLWVVIVMAIAVAFGFPRKGLAQQEVTIMQDGKPVTIQVSGDQIPFSASPGNSIPTLTPSAPQQDSGKKKEEKKDDKKKDDKKKDDKKKDDAKKGDDNKDGGKAKADGDSIKRPTAPPRVPDPREFDVKPDKNARLRFNFHGQPWPDILEWYARISGSSLDWQELPNDYINFSTERPYTLSETRDLFNRMLFERGYTMVASNNVLMVMKIEKLDPSLLIRVEDESELLDLSPHDFVKITFQLPRLLKAAQAAEEIKPLVSKHAKIQPLVSTNRLLVVDLVGNLRDISRLVNAEQAAADSHEVPKEFVIKHVRASDVADKVMVLLGLDPSTRMTSSELKIETQRLQLYSKLQSKGKDITKYLGKGKAQLFLTVNHNRNSILVNAAENELVIIENAIRMLDVPKSSMIAGGSSSLIMRKYPLATISPEVMLSALDQLADLDPRTQLKMDEDSKMFFAKGPESDHIRIAALVKELDGVARSFDVIWLRRLPADAVAKTITELMIGKEDDESSSRRRRYSYYGNGSDDDEDDEKFSVSADVENNRLLLFANPEEMKRVRGFLEKLGELPGRSGNPNTVRILDARGKDSTAQMLRKIEQMWPTIGNNRLIIERSTDSAPATEPSDAVTEPARDDEARNVRRSQISFANFSPEDDDAAESRAGSSVGKASDPIAKPSSMGVPITITINGDGRVVLSSNDTQALDMLEELIEQIAPQAKSFKVYYLKHALALLVTANLEEYFEEDGDLDTDDIYWRGWYGYDRDDKTKSDGTGLGKRKKIRFIYDIDTNSVLVSNATPEQHQTIEELIEIYDRPPNEEAISARRFKKFKLKFAKADAVAKTIKEVYRDLLSSKDSAFKDKERKEQTTQSTGYIRLFGGSEDKNKKPTKVKASFAGALSVGIDSISNALIVSAQEEWMDSIAEMIEFLDQEAAPYVSAVQVVPTSIDAKTLRSALARALSGKGVSGKKDKKANKNSGNGETPAPNANSETEKN